MENPPPAFESVATAGTTIDDAGSMEIDRAWISTTPVAQVTRAPPWITTSPVYHRAPHSSVLALTVRLAP